MNAKPGLVPIHPAGRVILPSARRLAAVLLCSLAGLAQAQPISGLGTPAARGNSAEPAAEAAAPIPPSAIPVAQIPARIEESRDLARRASEAARPVAAVAAVQEQLEDLQARIIELGVRIGDEELERVDMRTLELELEHVSELRRIVTGWQALLARRSSDLAGWRTSLGNALETWNLTETTIRRQDLPAELMASVTNILAILNDAARRVTESQERVVALQSSVSELLATIDDRRELIDTELARARAELFRPELPPIWRVERISLDLAGMRDSWDTDWGSLSRYLSARPVSVWAHIALLLLLLGAFAALSRKSHALIAERPDLARPLAAFRHPLAAAVVVAVLAAPWLYPERPQVLRGFFGVLLVLPLLRVLPLVVMPSLRTLFYLVLGLFLLVRLDITFLGGTELERYSDLLIAVFASASLAWIFRSGGPGTSADWSRWWKAARGAARASQLILFIAILANVFGLVSLSGLLVYAVVSSAFTAVVLFAGIVVIRAVLIAVFQTQLLQKLNIVRWHGPALDQWILRFLQIVALIIWVITTARMFRVDVILGNVVAAALYSSAKVGTIEISLGDILAFVVAIWIGLLVSRFLRFLLNVDVFPRVTLPRGVAATVSMLVNYVVLGFAVVIAIAAAGIRLDRFAIIVGALSVGIGFGLQNIVNNFISGLILAFERPVQSGDVVQTPSMFGRVIRIGVRSSTVRTFEGAEVIVPNADLISSEVTNWTLSDKRRRIEILVGVAYGSNPRRVLELLLNVATANERLLKNPEPSALFLGFGDSSLDFALRGWTDDFDNSLAIKSDLTLAVHDALHAHGIEIPFPQRDLHLRSVDAQAAARLGPVGARPVGEGDAADGPTLEDAPRRDPQAP